MTFADQTLHNFYLLNDIFSCTDPGKRYLALRAGDAIAGRGLLKLLQLKATYNSGDLKFSRQAMNLAAKGGHLEIVQWLHENLTEGCTAYAMDWAAAGGHLEIVKWLHANRKEGCSTYAMDWAAMSGHLEIITYLHTNRQEGCTGSAMDWAASNGHLRVVQWLHANRSELCSRQPASGWQGSTLWARRLAGEAGHTHIVEWLKENDPTPCEYWTKYRAKNGGWTFVIYRLEKEPQEEPQDWILKIRDTEIFSEIPENIGNIYSWMGVLVKKYLKQHAYLDQYFCKFCVGESSKASATLVMDCQTERDLDAPLYQ